MIECEALTKRFGAFTAVDHVNFAISRGSIYVFAGMIFFAIAQWIISAMLPKSRADHRITWFKVSAQNMESIHSHDAFAMVEWSRPETAGSIA